MSSDQASSLSERLSIDSDDSLQDFDNYSSPQIPAREREEEQLDQFRTQYGAATKMQDFSAEKIEKVYAKRQPQIRRAKKKVVQSDSDDDMLHHFLNQANLQDKQIDDPSLADLRQVVPYLGLNVLGQSKQKLPPTRQLKGQQRRTMNVLNRFQYAKVIGLRAKQISLGSAVYATFQMWEHGWLTALELAERQFRQGRLPFKIKRTHDDNTYEFWGLTELIYDFGHTPLQCKHLPDPYKHTYRY